MAQVAHTSGSQQFVNATMAVLSSGKVLLVGGLAAGGSPSKSMRFSVTRGSSWPPVPGGAPPWTPRFAHKAVVLPGDTILLVGGRTESSFLNDVWAFDGEGTNFDLATGAAPWAARAFHGLVVAATGSVVVLGGRGDPTYFNDVWVSEDAGMTWTLVTSSAAWSPRHGLGAVVCGDDSIMIAGGQSADGVQSDVWRSADGGVSWTMMANGVWPARSGFGMAAFGTSSLVILGGAGVSDDLSDAWASPDHGRTWAQFQASTWPARHSLLVGLLPDGAILVGGAGVGTGSDMWRGEWQPSWRSSPCTDAKPAVCGAPARGTAVHVELPSQSGSIVPRIAGTAAPGTFVYAPPVPIITLAHGQASQSPSDIVTFAMGFTSPVTNVTSDTVVVSSGYALVDDVVVDGAGSAYTIQVHVRPPTTILGEPGMCPPGYGAPVGSVADDTSTCLRVLASRATWSDASRACSPYALASGHTALHDDVIATFVRTSLPDQLVWYVARLPMLAVVALCITRCSAHPPTRFGATDVRSHDEFAWDAGGGGTVAHNSTYTNWVTGRPTSSGLPPSCGAYNSTGTPPPSPPSRCCACLPWPLRYSAAAHVSLC